MKKFSFLLVLFFLTSLTTAQTTNSTTAKATCRALLNGLEPCTTRDGIFTRLVTPINATCCDKINQIRDTCPLLIRRPLFAGARRSCKPANPAPSPQPSPPGKTCDFSRLRPCFSEMVDYLIGLQNSTITAGCCSTLLDLQGSCGPIANFRWPFFSKSLDYCHNHH